MSKHTPELSIAEKAEWVKRQINRAIRCSTGLHEPMTCGEMGHTEIQCPPEKRKHVVYSTLEWDFQMCRYCRSLYGAEKKPAVKATTQPDIQNELKAAIIDLIHRYEQMAILNGLDLAAVKMATERARAVVAKVEEEASDSDFPLPDIQRDLLMACKKALPFIQQFTYRSDAAEDIAATLIAVIKRAEGK